jgi:hypothetical protein
VPGGEPAVLAGGVGDEAAEVPQDVGCVIAFEQHEPTVDSPTGVHRPDLQPPPGDDSDYRRELFDAVTDLLRSVGQVRPVVCVLEDVHWAGTPTWQLLSHVTQHSAQSRLLLCTHRTTAPDRSDELTYAIADLYRLDGVGRIDLSWLDGWRIWSNSLLCAGYSPEPRPSPIFQRWSSPRGFGNHSTRWYYRTDRTTAHG